MKNNVIKLFVVITLSCFVLGTVSGRAEADNSAVLEKLHGSWKIDLEALLELNADHGSMSKQEKEKAMRLLEEAMSDFVISFDVHKMELTTYLGAAASVESFTVGASDGQIILSTPKGAIEIDFLDEKRISLSEDEQGTLIFYRE